MFSFTLPKTIPCPLGKKKERKKEKRNEYTIYGPYEEQKVTEECADLIMLMLWGQMAEQANRETFLR